MRSKLSGKNFTVSYRYLFQLKINDYFFSFQLKDPSKRLFFSFQLKDRFERLFYVSFQLKDRFERLLFSSFQHLTCGCSLALDSIFYLCWNWPLSRFMTNDKI